MIHPTISSKSHRRRILGAGLTQLTLELFGANVLAYWPLNETSGTTADNAEGTAARDGTYVGVSLNNSAFLNGNPVGLWDAGNDRCGIYTTSLRDAFDGVAGTVALWVRVSAAGVWSDGLFRALVSLWGSGHANDFVVIQKGATTDRIEFRYKAGGTQESVNDTSLAGTTDWFHLAQTWDSGADAFKAYINGSQVGSTQTGLGTWTENLSTTRSNLGARSTAPDQVWDGWLAHCFLLDRAATAAEIEQVYNWRNEK